MKAGAFSPDATRTGPTTATPATLPSSTHLPGLDGIRAVAVLLVIVHHALYQSLHKSMAQNILRHITGQGWVGVDLFFVLSGFLITGILMDVRNPRHALRNFYLRRALRIVPVYVAFLAFSLWIAPAIRLLSSAESVQLHQTQLWYWSYSVNILIALHSWSAASFPVVHLWSLAVEEQFYLLWPLAALLMSPVSLRRTAVFCIVAAELFRALVIAVGGGGQINYVLLPSRMDSLAAGAFLACAYRDPLLWQQVLRARRWLLAMSLLIIVGIVAKKHTIANQDPLEQLIAFPALVALASVIIATAAGATGWLTSSALRFIGKISYGMYVWHVMVIRFVASKIPSPDLESVGRLWIDYAILVIGGLTITMLIALFSWHIIERPILRLKRFVPYD